MTVTPSFVVVELWHAALEHGDREWFESLMRDDLEMTGLGKKTRGVEPAIERLASGGHEFRLLRVCARDACVVVKHLHEIHDSETGRLVAREERGAVFDVVEGKVQSIRFGGEFDSVRRSAGLTARDEKEPALGIWSVWHEHHRGHPAGQRIKYVLYSDSHFEGELAADLEPFTLRSVAPDGEIQTGHARPALALTVETRVPFPRSGEKSRTLTSAWHGGDIGDEFAALLSLASGVRVHSGGPVEGQFLTQGEPVTLSPRRPFLARPRFDGLPMIPGVARTESLHASRELLVAFTELGDEVARPLVRAARQYAQAIWEADGDPNLSWLRLVGALEAAAEGVPDSDASDVDLLAEAWPEMAQALKDDCNGEPERVASLLRDQTMVGKKLSRFVEAHPPAPPRRRPQQAQASVDWGNLAKPLAKVYRHRSAALHGGRPFPAFMCSPPTPAGPGEPVAEVPSGGGWAGGGSWADTDLPMHLHTFAHIVRESLMHWWRGG